VSGSHSGTTGSWDNVAVSENFNFFGLLLWPALWNRIWYMRYKKNVLTWSVLYILNALNTDIVCLHF